MITDKTATQTIEPNKSNDYSSSENHSVPPTPKPHNNSNDVLSNNKENIQYKTFYFGLLKRIVTFTIVLFIGVLILNIRDDLGWKSNFSLSPILSWKTIVNIIFSIAIYKWMYPQLNQKIKNGFWWVVLAILIGIALVVCCMQFLRVDILLYSTLLYASAIYIIIARFTTSLDNSSIEQVALIIYFAVMLIFSIRKYVLNDGTSDIIMAAFTTFLAFTQIKWNVLWEDRKNTLLYRTVTKNDK